MVVPSRGFWTWKEPGSLGEMSSEGDPWQRHQRRVLDGGVARSRFGSERCPAILHMSDHFGPDESICLGIEHMSTLQERA